MNFVFQLIRDFRFTAFSVLALSFISQLASAQAFADLHPQRILVPEGFDDNDQVVITADGHFPTPCFSLGQSKHSVDLKNRIIYIALSSWSESGQQCIQSLQPFEQTFNVGALPAGEYNVISLSISETQNKTPLSNRKASSHISTTFTVMPTSPATSSQPSKTDDYLYAPVDEATLQTTRSGFALRLKGYFKNTCFRLKDVRIKTTESIAVVQPIAEFVKPKEGEECKQARIPFHFTTTLPLKETFRPSSVRTLSIDSGFPEIVEKRILLHVRTAGGQFLNKMVDLRIPGR